MANLNKDYCDCQGIYNAATYQCEPSTPEVACPDGNGFWQTAAGWDWNAISENSLQWGYALGILSPPNAANLTNQVYMQELARQRQQMTMIMVGLGIAMLVVIVVLVRRK